MRRQSRSPSDCRQSSVRICASHAHLTNLIRSLARFSRSACWWGSSIVCKAGRYHLLFYLPYRSVSVSPLYCSDRLVRVLYDQQLGTIKNIPQFTTTLFWVSSWSSNIKFLFRILIVVVTTAHRRVIFKIIEFPSPEMLTLLNIWKLFFLACYWIYDPHWVRSSSFLKDNPKQKYLQTLRLCILTYIFPDAIVTKDLIVEVNDLIGHLVVDSFWFKPLVLTGYSATARLL